MVEMTLILLSVGVVWVLELNDGLRTRSGDLGGFQLV